MNKITIALSCCLFSIYISKGQKADFTPPKNIPRNIVIVMANGMGMAQVSAATLQRGSSLYFSRFPVEGFTQAWGPNQPAPTDSSTALAIATNKTGEPAPGTKEKNLFDWAKEQKMTTGIITTGSITGTNPRTFAIDHPEKKDDEAIAIEFLTAGVNVMIGGGSRFFDRRYDGKNIFNDFKKDNYDIESNMRRASKVKSPKTIGLVARNDLYGAGTRKDFIPETAINTSRTLNNANGYFLLVDYTKIKEGDSLNDIRLVTSEILDIDKLVMQINAESAGETLILVIGSYESGGLVVNTGNINKSGDADVKWTTRIPTASLAPVFASGPGSSEFAGTYPPSEIYKKLETMMLKRR